MLFLYAAMAASDVKTSLLDRGPAQSLQEPYSPTRIEAHWQQRWQDCGQHRTPEPRPGQDTFYALSMFPYPSGKLHVGHVRNYVITDVVARVQRMKGKAVLHPMGWDAFGLPAENAAIAQSMDPGHWTEQNIAQMRRQLEPLGLSLDWEREVTTCQPDYYRWTQWIFLELFAAGLAYQKEAAVNWDPVDQTVLANEQVDNQGRSWRSGALVELRLLRQWFLGITRYAKDLLEDLKLLEGWPERVRTMQANWIGRSTGTRVLFPLLSPGSGNHQGTAAVEVFTTRPDTLFGVTYMVLAPEHPLVDSLTEPDQQASVAAFRDEMARTSTLERTAEDRPKRGVPLGSHVRHPLSGEPVPVWIADYVLLDYGSGAVMGVPAHDSRDFDFARRHGLPVTVVITPDGQDSPGGQGDLEEAFCEEGVLVHSGEFNGLPSNSAKARITAALAAQQLGEETTTYRLRDWLVSRQRYWGCPHSHHPLPKLWRRARSPGSTAGGVAPGSAPVRQGGHPPGQGQGVAGGEMPRLRRTRPSGNRHHGHVHVLQLVLPALCGRHERPGGLSAGEGGSVAAGESIRGGGGTCRHAPALLAILHQGVGGPGPVGIP